MMLDARVAMKFLEGQHLAVVGATDDRQSFGRTIYLELRKRGHDVVAVNRSGAAVAGDAAYPDLASVPGDLDGVVIMVNPVDALDVVRRCIDRGIPRVWLFKGLGGPGAVSTDAVELCQANGIEVVAGACPMMFLEPTGLIHRIHRGARHLHRSLTTAA